MNIKAVIFASSISQLPTLPADDIAGYLKSIGVRAIFYYGNDYRELLWDTGLKRKEALVLTTDENDTFAAHEAFCRHWLLDNAKECTVDKVQEIISSNKFGI